MIGGQALEARFVVESAINAGGSADLRLRNRGNLDAMPPAVDLPAHCRLGDALGRYRLQSTKAALQLAPDPDAWLAAGEGAWISAGFAAMRHWNGSGTYDEFESICCGWGVGVSGASSATLQLPSLLRSAAG
ncbi:MAG: hypothetical protein IPO66_14915 [Rhodanobacteraceae bacterium]|nr:hypothetical protein [Rhodanobacteraceae bacterium]